MTKKREGKDSFLCYHIVTFSINVYYDENDIKN